MKIITVLTFTFLYSFCFAKEVQYHGCSPADAAVREFLNISRTDSIDFIRWKLVLNDNQFEINCSYGLCQPNTNGFSNEQRVSFSGSLKKQGNYYELLHNDLKFYLLEINTNLVHLLDQQKKMLIGNGGWSYTLCNTSPVQTGQFNIPVKASVLPRYMAYEGRTPCNPLSKMIGRGSPQCIKLKWYMILYTDSTTGKPTYYLTGGRQYRKETMQRGNWDIITGKDGRIIYRLNPEKKEQATHLLAAGDAILLFTDALGNPLVGSADFSFTLNRTKDQEPL